MSSTPADENTNDDAPPRPAVLYPPRIARIPRAAPLPTAIAGHRRAPSLVWLVPLLVVLIAAASVACALWQRGPTVTITFATAEGLEANKTTIRYKSVVIGVIKSIDLLDDRSGVVVTADLSRQVAGLLVDDARFWVVRPRVSAAGVSGMGTLLSGAHVAFDAGASSHSRRAFTGLEATPTMISDRRGRLFTLRAESIGSLDVGSPLYLRRFQVGQVTRVALDSDGGAVRLEVFVDAPYDKQVTTDTRFWNASGVDVTLDTRGLRLDTQSLAAVLVGGIALETPPTAVSPAATATEGAEFQVFSGRDAALRATASKANEYVLVWHQPVRGLTAGAPVELAGLEVGEVVQVDSDFETDSGASRTLVTVNFRPERIHLRPSGASAAAPAGSSGDGTRALLRRLVARGMRAQLRTGNVLTGQRYVAFDIPAAPVATRPRGGRAVAHAKAVNANANADATAAAIGIDWTRMPVMLPTVDADSDGLPEALVRLAAKIEKLPLDRLAREGVRAAGEMRQTLAQASGLMERVNADIAPQMASLMVQSRRTMASVERTMEGAAPLQRDLKTALRDVSGAGQAFRTLAEYLERHPESVLRGKKEDAR